MGMLGSTSRGVGTIRTERSSPSAPHPVWTRKPVPANPPPLARLSQTSPLRLCPLRQGFSQVWPCRDTVGAPPAPSSLGTRRAGKCPGISRINVFLENSHPEALGCKHCLLFLHFVQLYFHNQLIGAGGGSVCSGSKALGVPHCPQRYAGLREHSSLTPSLTPSNVTAGHWPQALGWREPRLALATKKRVEK